MDKDKIFLKTKYDGLWESNPHLAFLPCMFGGIIGLFVFLFFINHCPLLIFFRYH